MLVFKILTPDEMDDFRRGGFVPLVEVDRADGYVHLSTGAQVAETAARHFSGHQALWLLAAEAEALGTALKWEPSRGGDLFPHYYGQLRAADILWSKPLAREIDGSFRFPEEVGP